MKLYIADVCVQCSVCNVKLSLMECPSEGITTSSFFPLLLDFDVVWCLAVERFHTSNRLRERETKRDERKKAAII